MKRSPATSRENGWGAILGRLRRLRLIMSASACVYGLVIAWVGWLGLTGSESGSIAEVTRGEQWVSALFSLGHLGAGLTFAVLSWRPNLPRTRAVTLLTIAALTALHAWMLVDAAEWSDTSRQTSVRLMGGVAGLVSWACLWVIERQLADVEALLSRAVRDA